MTEIPMRVVAALASRYRIEREIGAGGMATVYLARDLKHDRDVAVKVLRPEIAAVLGVNRFLNEIRITAGLDHPHILTLIDSGVADGFPYYVLPFVRGESLRDKLKREKQLALDEALDISREITAALDYAHGQGIVHRDIKPENILLHEGEAMLADFGIAVAVKEAGGVRLTESGVSLGTPQYMSPEQATGDRPLDARSDVYSVAAVLYEMLAGEPPHSGATVQVIIAKLLTERPTRLRVLRDSVPEGVETAVAKALAKLPADRYASIADFARALATHEAPRRPIARSRRWGPIALGGAAATVAAMGAALLLAREPAPPRPDRVQLTITGNASAASLSPDGARVAFVERVCDTAGYCTYQLVIQETDGGNRGVLTRNIANVYRTMWTRDGRYIEFEASYGAERRGAFVVSTLGGEPRYLGRSEWGTFDLLAGDTAFIVAPLSLGDSISWVRRITAHDGQALDSFPARYTGHSYDLIALTYPDRLLIAVWKTAYSAPELRLIDFSGAVIDSVTPGFGSLGRSVVIRWVPSRQRLVIAAMRTAGIPEFDLLTMRVTASRIERGVDTVFSRLELGDGRFDVSPDGERLVHSAGPMEGSLWRIDTLLAKEGRFAATLVKSSTTRLRAVISPAGDRIVIAREIPTSGGRVSDLSILSGSDGAESQIVRGVPDLLDFGWSRDSRTVMYLHGTEGNKVRLIEIDTTGRRTPDSAPSDQADAVAFHPLPDGALCIIPQARRSLSIIRRRGKRDVTWNAPSWIHAIWTVSLSPDAKSLAVLATGVGSIVVATVDIETGRFAKLGSVAGEWLDGIKWLDDGRIVFDLWETQGAWALYTTRPGGPIQRLGALPLGDPRFSVSNDGRHMVASNFSHRNDVYMIRNFGELLRR